MGSVKAPNPYKKPVRILLLGSDSRSKIIKNSRSDSIILLQVNPDHSAQMVSFPRDSKIYVPGRGRGKINSAMAYGGPKLTVKAIEQYSGLNIDYYMVTSFPGMQNLINDLGGLKINIDMPLHDKYSGANLSAGTQVITGGQALAVARDRHSVPNGDFTRADHQQDIAEAVFLQERERRRGFISMAKLIPLILRETETDLSGQELFKLIRTVLAVNPKKVSKTVLKGNAGRSGGASVVILDKGYANRQFAKMSKKNSSFSR